MENPLWHPVGRALRPRGHPRSRKLASRHAEGRRAARAKEIVQNLGGGEVVIHDRRGEIRDKDTLRPAKHPFPGVGRRRRATYPG